MVMFSWLVKVEATTKYIISDVYAIKIGRQEACLPEWLSWAITVPLYGLPSEVVNLCITHHCGSILPFASSASFILIDAGLMYQRLR